MRFGPLVVTLALSSSGTEGWNVHPRTRFGALGLHHGLRAIADGADVAQPLPTPPKTVTRWLNANSTKNAQGTYAGPGGPQRQQRNGPGDVRFPKDMQQWAGPMWGAPAMMTSLRTHLEQKRYGAFVKTLKNVVVGTGVSAPKRTHNDHGRTEPGQELLNLIVKHVNSFDATCTAEVVWIMSRIGFGVSTPLEREVMQVLLDRLCQLQRNGEEEITPRIVTTSLGGFAKLGLRWHFVSQSNKEDVVGMIGLTAASLNDREVSNLLHALSKMTIPWATFPKAVQDSLLESFTRESSALVSQQGSMTIYSLGLMGLSVGSVPPNVRDRIYTVALSVLREDAKNAQTGKTALAKRYACQQISNVIYGLGKLGASLSTLPPEVSSALYKAVEQSHGLMNNQEIANTVYSHGLMGVRWAELPPDYTALLQSSIAQHAGNMIDQGLSNTVYGLGLMGTPWGELTQELQDSLLSKVVDCFSTKLNPHPAQAQAQRGQAARNGGPQAYANVVYSLGEMGADWDSFPAALRLALEDGMEQWGPELKTQEISNAIYGLGCLSADYSALSPRFKSAITKTIRGVLATTKKIGTAGAVPQRKATSPALAMLQESAKNAAPQPGAGQGQYTYRINEQEVCSTVYGFAKMKNARWSELSPELRHALIELTGQLAAMGSLCLACTAYSFGVLGAQWSDLPERIQELLISSAAEVSLQDQTISNVVYGMSLLGVQWSEMDPRLRSTLMTSLRDPNVFSSTLPACGQHVCNTLWGLAKMGVAWHTLPQENLLRPLVSVFKTLQAQETANAFYALAIMDASWTELSVEVRDALINSRQFNKHDWLIQEVANVVYSLALLTCDFPYEPPGPGNSKDMKKLWAYHDEMIHLLSSYSVETFAIENYDQFSIYFEMLDAMPGGYDFVVERLGKIPTLSGPAATVPSRLHALTAHRMLEALNALPLGWPLKPGMQPRFSIQNEFNGLRGVFPVDVAVYYDDRLIALVEIDGEFHYKVSPLDEAEEGAIGPPRTLSAEDSKTLRRKDKLKELCYRKKYPDVDFFRIRDDQIEALGYRRAGAALATWISNAVVADPANNRARHRRVPASAPASASVPADDAAAPVLAPVSRVSVEVNAEVGANAGAGTEAEAAAAVAAPKKKRAARSSSDEKETDAAPQKQRVKRGAGAAGGE